LKNRLYCKILAVGIIVLFMGVSVSSGFAVNDKTTETVTIITDNENHVTASGDVYENTNCFVMGSVGNAVSEIHFYGEGKIAFGWKWSSASIFHPSGGWIYTNGDNGKWLYHSRLKSGFLGNIRSYQGKDWWSGSYFTRYVGVEGFRGLELGGHPFQVPMEDPNGAHCFFYGRADHVKIISV
jgi:hypothetical protein